MAIPYRARVNERWFLNHPGFHGGAYVVAYVEDTSERGPIRWPTCGDDCRGCPHNFEARTILEIADCDEAIRLDFDVDSEAGRVNSLHKVDTLLAALRVFRAGLVEEFAEYDRRERELLDSLSQAPGSGLCHSSTRRINRALVDVQAKLQSAAQTLKETTSSATTKVVQEARSRAPSGFRQLAGFAFVLVLVALILGASNWAQHRDQARDRLWGELLFFALVIWFSLAVLSAVVGIGTGRLSGKASWLRWTRIDPISRKQALAWAGITVVAVPLAILYRWESVAVLVVVSLLTYALMQFGKRRRGLETRVPLCYAVVVGTLALTALAWASADQDVEDATLADPTRAVLGAESLARQFRPRLFFDTSERLPPVDVEDATMHGCTQGVGAEECDNPVSPTGSLDEFDYIKLTGTELREGEKPGGPTSAYYYHVVEDGSTVYIDYWWYFAHNPSPFARALVCGQALRWLGEACAEHPADWEGITLALVPCQVARRLAPGCAGAEGRAFRVSEARYAQHEKAVTYPWEMLQERWRAPGYARWYEGSRLRPLVFIALGSHASYAGPCGRCPQIVRKSLQERRNGMVPWTNNTREGCKAGSDATKTVDCLKPLPLDRAGKPAQWNAFPGRWGTQYCILFGSYCDVQRAPRAPSYQKRYRQLRCTPKLCITSGRL